MKTLILGGTRFVGKPLVNIFLNKGFDLTLFTRGNNQIPDLVKHIKGDRSKEEDLVNLPKNYFDLIVDTSGRKLLDTQMIIAQTGIPKFRYIYMSSAGVYKNSEILPIDENEDIDPNSRHIGKFETEDWLLTKNIPFTSFRPTYIYGPGNYNPIEKWFFDRLLNNRVIPIPGMGESITQLVHVNDLAKAINSTLSSDISKNKIYNCSGKKAISFKGLVELSAKVCGIDQKDINYKYIDKIYYKSKARKAFPLRLENFFTTSLLLENDTGWTPSISLEDGINDSYKNDYLTNKNNKPDFTLDQLLIDSINN